MNGVWAVLLVVVGGLLTGGVIATWRRSAALAVVLGFCAALAVTSGMLRMEW